MALISIKRNIDLQPGLNAPAVFNCSQSDKGTTIMLGLMNGGNDYTVPSGVTITIMGSRSNGAVFTPVSATSSGSTVSFTLTEEMTDTAGPTLCEAVLEQGNNVLGTANFIINVEASPMGADVPPVFTDAAWTWMLGKLTTETVPALGDDVISSIQGKVDKSQGSTNAKKFLRVNTSGNVSLASTDKTLSVADQIADAKETGDQIRALDAEIDGVTTTLGGSISTLNGITTDLQSSKLNKNQGTSNAGKTMVVDSSGNIVPGDVPITIDDTLSIADAAADAKAAGDAIALKANASTIAPEFSDQNTYTAGSYLYKNGVLYKFTSAHTGAWTGTDAVVVTVGGEIEGVKSTITDYGHYINGNEDLLLCVGYTENYSINASGVITPNNVAHYTDLIPVESDEYLFVYTSNGANNNTRIHAYNSNGEWLEQVLLSQSGSSTAPIEIRFTPSSETEYIRISTNKVVKPLFLAKTYFGRSLYDAMREVREVEETKKQVDLYTDSVIGAKEIINSISWVEGYSIGVDGTVSSNAYFHYTNPIPVNDGMYKYTYKGTGTNNNTRIHGYDANGNWLEQILLSRSETSTSPITVDIPCNGYSFIRISTAKVIESISLITPLIIDLYSGSHNGIELHTKPENQGVINAIKRARQMTDLEWIPGADLLRAFMDTGDTYLTSHSQTYQGRFAAGEKYKGIPYSERNAPYRWLGIEVPFDAFCSAIQKNNSVIAEESTYTQYGADYYGCVCTSLTCYALDLPYTVSTKYSKIPGMTYIATITSNFNASILKLGDIVQISGHCAIITDIYTDEIGRITYIEVSEATRQGNSNRSHLTGKYGSVCRRITMSIDEFTTWFANFYIYRYSYINKVSYFPCAYVPMPDEGNRDCIHDYPLMPYMGNKTTYGTDTAPTVKIIFDTDAYTTLVVYKNGVLFGTYNISGQTYYDVVCDTDEAKYTACLAVLDSSQNISYSTQTVEWYCRPHDTPVYSVSNDTVTISVTNSGEFKPYCIIFDTTFINGDYIKLFDTDFTKTVNNNTVTYTFTLPFPYAETKNCKLYLRSDEWGVVEYNFTINP